MSQAPFFHQCFLILSFSDHPLHRFSFAHLKNLCHKVNMTTTPNCPVIKFPKVSSWRFFHFSIFLLPPAGSREEHQRSKLLRGDTECNLRRKSKLVSTSKNTQIQNTNTQVLVMSLMMMIQGHGAESAGLAAQSSCWVELVLILLSVLKIKLTPPTILQCSNYTSQ